ncbi:MAG: rhodanese-like domain-containing protein [Chlorobi bacterium]|nr:rhodanese-like domain-containing protein [Chlorobiota bacterium]
MNRNYFILTVLMLVLATGTLFLKQEPKRKQIKPEDLLYEIIQPTRYVTTDQIARIIIEKDPTLELVDVRDAKSYDQFALPNAINIPTDSLLSPNYQDYFGIPGMKVVFYSNDDILADQAWVLTRRMGINETYVMKGGLNHWIETIIQPKEPPEDAPYTAFEQYQFRKGAQMYFTGAKVDNTSQKKKKVIVKRRKKETAVAGGC